MSRRRLACLISLGVLGGGCGPAGVRAVDAGRDAIADVAGDGVTVNDGAQEGGRDVAPEIPSVEGMPCLSTPTCGPTAWCNPDKNACQLRSKPPLRSFATEINPMFAQLSCVGCHMEGGSGAVNGSAGAPLLLARSPYENWSSLVAGSTDCSDALARRICVDEPRLSLLARFPLRLPGEQAHSTVFMAFESWGEPQLQMILEWIAQGARFDGVIVDGGQDGPASDRPVAPDAASDPSVDAPGTGGASATGGRGGMVGSGGVVGSGGMIGSGGMVGSGGVVGSGGMVGSGGVVGSGGMIGSGGLIGSGGIVGSGGVVATGGRAGASAGGAGGTAPDTTPPGAPPTVTATPTSCRAVTISWSASTDNQTPSNQLTYDVCTSTNPTACTTGASGTHQTIASPTMNASFAGLTVETPYYAAVRAIDAAGNRSLPSTASSTIPTDFGNVAPPPPVGPLSFSATLATGTTVSWVAGSNDCASPAHLTYQVCVSTSAQGCGGAAGVWTTTQTTPAGVTTAALSGLTSNTAYTVFVRAADPDGRVSTAVSGNQTTKYSYARDVMPVLVNNCNGSGCHSTPARIIPTDYSTLTSTSRLGGLNACLNLVSRNGNPLSSFVYAIALAPTCGSGQMAIANTAGLTAMQAWLIDGAPDN